MVPQAYPRHGRSSIDAWDVVSDRQLGRRAGTDDRTDNPRNTHCIEMLVCYVARQEGIDECTPGVKRQVGHSEIDGDATSRSLGPSSSDPVCRASMTTFSTEPSRPLLAAPPTPHPSSTHVPARPPPQSHRPPCPAAPRKAHCESSRLLRWHEWQFCPTAPSSSRPDRFLPE